MKGVEDALREWDEQYRIKVGKGRSNKLTITKSRAAPSAIKPARANSAQAAREQLGRIIRKAPEVMVKVSGGGKGMIRIKAHFDYISRNGEVGLENEAGQTIQGRESVMDLRDEWKYGLYGTPEDSHRKEAFNIVLSMPAGTDRQAVKDAARVFAATEFAGNHQYVFAAHDDEDHPHVHLCVKALGIDGTRLNPRKADLQRWREGFAEAMRDQGIDANATPRHMRGSRHRSVHQAVRHMGNARHDPSPSSTAVYGSKQVIQGYAKLATALAQREAEDRNLAVSIVNVVSGFVKNSEPLDLSGSGPSNRRAPELSTPATERQRDPSKTVKDAPER